MIESILIILAVSFALGVSGAFIFLSLVILFLTDLLIRRLQKSRDK